jgi:hypothetical protein
VPSRGEAGVGGTRRSIWSSSYRFDRVEFSSSTQPYSNSERGASQTWGCCGLWTTARQPPCGAMSSRAGPKWAHLQALATRSAH